MICGIISAGVDLPCSGCRVTAGTTESKTLLPEVSEPEAINNYPKGYFIPLNWMKTF